MRNLSTLAVILFVGAACTSTESQVEAVHVVVDPRIELASAVQVLSDYFLVTDHEFGYKQAMRDYFAPYADHEAVQLFRTMSEEGFNFDRVPRVFLALTNPPELGQRIPHDQRVLDEVGGEELLQRFVVAARAFADTSDFGTFYDAHQDLYATVIAQTETVVNDAVTGLEEYTGMSLGGAATVVLGPVLHDGGFAPSFATADGGLEAYAVVGPTGTVGNMPDFGGPGRMRGLVSHEFAHVVVNPLTAEQRDLVTPYAALFDPIRDLMRMQAYDNWETVVNEHIVRAINVRLTALAEGEDTGANRIQRQLERGFVHVPAFAERLREFEADREQYSTLAAFYPRLLEVLAVAEPTGVP
jgi:hypothetical protein